MPQYDSAEPTETLPRRKMAQPSENVPRVTPPYPLPSYLTHIPTQLQVPRPMSYPILPYF
ncbi:hypothetical protein EV363DRAFT_1172714 [Boletus edulis]|uniref:Uncharacterized protein n=1 Tax=Boletus edulis BED1 TaxID=1328754 RepID=A0AAD4GMQ4_BOLED|nr:hypothetical protein EV363DRAFT_1172714 [Boletus edulis]KAF8414511.1 hypothetical protein L210DRAFT_3592179 [Boletus edulis BED1]KAF8451959.1 hypothetical protein L210DRAFT_3515026 [Boletus edulis BED1]